MVRLMKEARAKTLGKAGEQAARSGDSLTADPCIEHRRMQEKVARMLRGHLR
jgi:hypothetical protein